MTFGPRKKPSIWVLERNLACVLGGAFLKSGRPRGPGKAFKNVGGFAHHFLNSLTGPRGRPGLKKAPNTSGQIAFRFSAKPYDLCFCLLSWVPEGSLAGFFGGVL